MQKLQKGFSLVEMIVVIMIVGLLSTAIISRFSESQDLSKLEFEALQIESLLQRAKKLSLGPEDNNITSQASSWGYGVFLESNDDYYNIILFKDRKDIAKGVYDPQLYGDVETCGWLWDEEEEYEYWHCWFETGPVGIKDDVLKQYQIAKNKNIKIEMFTDYSSSGLLFSGDKGSIVFLQGETLSERRIMLANDKPDSVGLCNHYFNKTIAPCIIGNDPVGSNDFSYGFRIYYLNSSLSWFIKLNKEGIIKLSYQ